MSDWRSRATCTQVNPELWFPEPGSKAAKAKKICRTVCPVRSSCLASALDMMPTDGIWAGYNIRELRKLRNGRKSCERCGTMFDAGKTGQKYCGEICAFLARRELQAASERRARAEGRRGRGAA